MKNRHDLFLQYLAQIDQNIAATDQVKIGEGGINDHVLPRKNTHVADGFADLVDAVGLDEKAAQPFRRDIQLDVFRINARPGFFQRRLADVRRKNLDQRVAACRVKKLDQIYRQRIG